MTDWPFGSLKPLHYGMLMVDPPWSFANWSADGGEKSPSAHYACVSTADLIEQFPVGHLAGGDCWLWLWATHPMLPDAMRALQAWRFQFVTSGVWVKTTPKGGLAFGTGYVLRSASKPFLIGKVGKPPVCNRSIRTAIMAPRGRHSAKPAAAYKAAAALAGPNAFMAEVFSRTRRRGWDTFGDEDGKFGEAAE